ncbi:DUF4129 domain-containing transglutaminase family protein [Brevibacillus marinus]|uniref:DUF4129 domain-containing transglutaminase family protein n=1 Tax=Brevibacillus marinus TaxID=2496837 RepID=UPI000F83DD1C|nr:transglutaminase domain-containing protein [Brevibacillus marinus]
MRQPSFWKRSTVHSWLAALFLFLLIREWLIPLPVLTDTGELTSFYLVVGSVLLLDLLFASRLLTSVLKLAGVGYLIHSSFFVTPLFDTRWLSELSSRLVRDVPLIFQQSWLEMSPISRNLLFDLLLVVIVSLLSYLILELRQGLWFVCLTEAYLSTLDTFLPYEADGAVIRALVAGFLLLATIHFASVASAANVAAKNKLSAWRILLAPAMIICLTVGVAYAGPKKAPSWPDPVPFLTGQSGAMPGGGISKVGYDDNDEQLGGPFVQDDRVVFRAATNGMYYWRGDSKDVYTGHGWVKQKPDYQAILNPRQHTWENLLFKGLETEQVESQVLFEEGQTFSTVFYPGQVTELRQLWPRRSILVQDSEYVSLEVHEAVRDARQQVEADGVITTLPVNISRYQLTAEVPILSEKALVHAGEEYPDSIRQRYLQLPDSLPQRVIELAREVTQSADTPYEKVRAVEMHLRYSSRYQYETEDVPVVRPDQDFVDQFLFESKRGYCDHFSTAMVVMLRASGVPARWVKGFAPGEEVDTDGERKLVEVRSRDAHSWVEVYFPNYGWLPFEATATFTSPLRVHYDLETPSGQTPTAPSEVDTPERGPDESRLEELDEQPMSSDSGGYQFSWKLLIVPLAVLAAAAAGVWLFRRRLLVWWLRRKLDAYGEPQFREKYGTLLLLYEQVLGARQAGETLREYVRRLHVSQDVRQDLWFLTQLYERMLYGYREVEEKWRGAAAKMIKRLSQQLKP